MPFKQLSFFLSSGFASSLLIAIVSAALFSVAATGLAKGQTTLKPAEECQPKSRLVNGWPNTDFSQCTVSYDDIISGGPGKDGIPAIDAPQFINVDEVTIAPQEPVISLEIDGIARSYPLSILIWHEIVNDAIHDVPFSVTYCPLCNTSIIFDRRLDDQILDFGTTGNLRHSDLVMYDRQTESWWQQFNGDAIAGSLAGKQLAILPSRLESFGEFAERHPDGEVLAIPTNFLRSYGTNPYNGYDSSSFPFLFRGEVPEGIKPLERVVVVDDFALALPALMETGIWRHGAITIRWQKGQASALDQPIIAEGRDVGTVTVQAMQDHGKFVDIPYKVTFAFVWHAFHPDKQITGISG